MTRTASGGVRSVFLFLAVLLAAQMAVWVVAAEPANAGPILSDSFDRDADAFVGPWTTKNACAADRLTTDSALKRAGTHSMKLTVKDGDISPCTYTSNPRAQVEKADLFPEGAERFIGHSTYFPANFPTIGSSHWLIFSSYGFRAPYNGSAPGKFRVKSGTSDRIEYARDERTGHDAVWEGAITKGAWTDLVVHIKFSTDPAVGYVEIYKNGSLQTLKNGKTRFYYATLKPGQTGAGSWNFSQYRSKGAAPEITLHHDEAKVGTSYAEVAPSSTTTADTTAPEAEAPSQGFATASTLGTSLVPVKLAWSSSDEAGGSGVAGYQLQQSVNGGAYSNVTLPSATATTVTPSLKPTYTYRFRVAAKDRAGNVSDWAYGPSFKVNAHQENAAAVAYPGGTWTRAKLSGAYGSYVKYAKTSGATAKLAFAGSNVAWVAPRSSTRGKAEVYVDGALVQTVDLYSSSTQARQVVFAKSWAASGSHTLEVRVLGTAGRPRVDTDAFVVLQ